MGTPLYLVAVDGSECSNRAVEHAMNLATITNAKVKFLTVRDWSYLQPAVVEGIAPQILDQETETLNTINHILAPLIEQYNDAGVDISTELLWGDPAVEIQKQIKDLNVTMLFVGRQGKSRIVDILLGSVANKLAHLVDIPIVLVP
ncbi:universal stress protein [Colwelliaceae bacterium 6441]